MGLVRFAVREMPLSSVMFFACAVTCIDRIYKHDGPSDFLICVTCLLPVGIVVCWIRDSWRNERRAG